MRITEQDLINQVKIKRKFFSSVADLFRQLCIKFTLTQLSRLDSIMQTLKLSMNVKNMTQFNSSEFNVRWLISRILKSDDSQFIIRMKKIKYLTYESSTLRYIFSQIRDYVLSVAIFETVRKVIVMKNTSLITWFYKCVLNHLHIFIKILAAYLTVKKRKKMIDDFNNVEIDVVILIIMYVVNAQNLNLDSHCSKVLIAASTVNITAKIQTWKCVLRASYTFISVWRLC